MKNNSILADKDILLKIINEVHARGVVGEEDSIICLVLKIMLRFCLNADSVSGNVIVSDKSGSGKDWLVSRLCSVLLKDVDYECFTHITESVLAYYDVNWSQKVLHVKDPSFDLLNSNVFKTIAEGRSHLLSLRDMSVVKIAINGKPVMIVTALNVSIGDEAVRRWDVIQLDTSDSLTKAVINSKLSDEKSVVNDSDFVKALKNEFKLYSVVVPFGDSLTNIFTFNLDSRSSVGKLMDYIRASAILHQFQRKRDKSGNVIATWFDFELGFFVFRHLNKEIGRSLSRDDVKLLELLESNSNGVYVRSIIAVFHKPRDWIYRHLGNLKALGLVDGVLHIDEVTNRELEVYSVSKMYLSLYKFNKSVFRSVAFDEVKSFFELLDNRRKEIGLNLIFSDWLSRK